MVRLLILLNVVWLLLVSGSQTARAVKFADALIEIRTVADVCSKNQNDLKCIAVVTIGSIAREDSLFGFDFQVSFDSEKLKFDRMLDANTFAEFFEYKSASAGFEPGIVTGYAVTFGMAPVYGNLPLFALVFDWIDECPDSAEIQIDYIEFTDEFKIEIDNYFGDFAKAIVKDKPERRLDLKIEADTLFFDNSDVAQGAIYIEKNDEFRLTNLDLEIQFPTDYFEIENITANDDNIEIVDVEYLVGGVNISATFESSHFSSEILKFDLKTNFETDSLFKVKAFPVKVGYCDCITRLNGIDFWLKTFSRDTTTDTTSVKPQAVRDRILTAHWIESGEIFRIHCCEDDVLIQDVMIYNLTGSLINEKMMIRNRFADLYLSNLPRGVYMAIVKLTNGIVKEVVVIKP